VELVNFRYLSNIFFRYSKYFSPLIDANETADQTMKKWRLWCLKEQFILKKMTLQN
jgi:hypothetical protein